MYYSRNSDTHKDPQNVSPKLGTSKTNPVCIHYTVYNNISIYLQVWNSLELLFLILLADIMTINTILEHI